MRHYSRGYFEQYPAMAQQLPNPLPSMTRQLGTHNMADSTPRPILQPSVAKQPTLPPREPLPCTTRRQGANTVADSTPPSHQHPPAVKQPVLPLPETLPGNYRLFGDNLGKLAAASAALLDRGMSFSGAVLPLHVRVTTTSRFFVSCLSPLQGRASSTAHQVVVPRAAGPSGRPRPPSEYPRTYRFHSPRVLRNDRGWPMACTAIQCSPRLAKPPSITHGRCAPTRQTPTPHRPFQSLAPFCHHILAKNPSSHSL
jgi:hypothetical protein